MIRWLIPAAAGLIGLILGFQLMLGALPGFIMSKAMERFESLGGIANEEGHAPPIDETARSVVRPSPDILYSGCLFDVSNGPMTVTAPAPSDGGYASVSFFDSRTNNFAVINDRAVEGGSVRIILRANPGFDSHDDSTGYDADTVIMAPTDTGLILYRRIWADPGAFEETDTDRRRFDCSLG
ncbi:DUF1254 domain-containing protein [Maricaulis sp.]|uniref:DUF1254 domain-containing protein n=1 Tax=Maricaulis sp. TaxID=1486257 RepID=UPI0026398C80|nr:DUF1254 domain-containing protein [Maricaulis sp.]